MQNMVGNERKSDIGAVINRMKKGEEEAFSEFYDQYHKYIYYVASKYVSTKEDREDLMQNTFFIIFKKLNNIKLDGNILGWMGRVVLTAYGEKVKRETRLKRKADIHRKDISEMYELEDKIATPEEVILDDEKKAAINALIENLPQKQKRTVFMYYFQELSTKEIPEIERCSESSVRNALFKAREALKDKLLTGKERELVGSFIVASLHSDVDGANYNERGCSGCMD